MHAGNACSTTRQSREALDQAVGALWRATVEGHVHAGNACGTTRRSREVPNPCRWRPMARIGGMRLQLLRTSAASRGSSAAVSHPPKPWAPLGAPRWWGMCTLGMRAAPRGRAVRCLDPAVGASRRATVRGGRTARVRAAPCAAVTWGAEVDRRCSMVGRDGGGARWLCP